MVVETENREKKKRQHIFYVSLQNLHSSLVRSGDLPSGGRTTLLQLINGKRERNRRKQYFE